MSAVGKSYKRLDAYDKVTGRAKFYADTCPDDALWAKVVRSTITHGKVLSFDLEEALAVEGVVKIITCFDVPKHYYPTAGHPYSIDPAHADIADKNLLTTHVRQYGDDIAVVVADTELHAKQAAAKVKVEYEEYPFVLDQLEAIKDGAPQIHEEFDHNILAHTGGTEGNYQEAIKEEGLICVDKWYEIPMVQHSHMENHGCYAWMERGKIVVVSSTQIPHIVTRIIGQALGCDWGKIRVIKPYIGGGFGNKQDALYEPLCAYLTTQLGGRLVRIDCAREETFVHNRVRHAAKIHLITYARPDGTFVARKYEAYFKQGAYASQGHSIGAKSANGFRQMYPCANYEWDVYTIYTNQPSGGAMRGYGMPQNAFAMECHSEDIAAALHMDPVELRLKNLMPVGYKDAFSGNVNWTDSYQQCLKKAMEKIDYKRKYAEYQNQTGPIRKGIGMAFYWYNTSVYPISMEHSSCRMSMNADGSIQVQVGETEIGQGADTAYAQMAADAVGLRFDQVNVVTNQDTDITPFGLGAYASRQTYVAGMAIWECGQLLRKKCLHRAAFEVGRKENEIDLIDGEIVEIATGKVLMSMGEVSVRSLYENRNTGEYTAQHLTAEVSHEGKSNAYSFGCSIAEVEVDIPMCKVSLVNMVNVHDCGNLINPALAEAQVHGGMSMAIGYGMSEELLFDEKTGRPLNNNLLDYKLSTFMDHPRLMGDFCPNAEPTHPFGTKALGEPPACPGAPAIRNAIFQATGVAVDTAPVNPKRLYVAFKEAGLFEK